MGDTTKFEGMFRRFLKSFVETELTAQDKAREEAEIMDAAFRAMRLDEFDNRGKSSQSDDKREIHVHVHVNE